MNFAANVASVAELIHAAERGTPAERSKARKSATATILNIWEHRTSLPGKAYPLAPYKDALKVLDRLRPDDNPFQYGLHDVTKKEQLAVALFDGLTRLIIALLLMRVPPADRFVQVDSAAVEGLSEPEQRVLKALNQWSAFFVSKSESRRRSSKINSSSRTMKVNLDEVACRLVDGMMTTLAELREELQKDHP